MRFVAFVRNENVASTGEGYGSSVTEHGVILAMASKEEEQAVICEEVQRGACLIEAKREKNICRRRKIITKRV